MNSNESIHTIFSNIIDKWSENFKKDMEPLLKVVDNIHMKNNIINEILKSMPEYKLLEESNKKLIIENLELKNKLENNIILPEDSKELELCISDYEILETNKNNNIDSVENHDNIIINNIQEEDKKNETKEVSEEKDEENEVKEIKKVEEDEEETEEEEEDEECEEDVSEEEEVNEVKNIKKVEEEKEEEDEEETEEEGEENDEDEERQEETEDVEEEVFIVEIQGKNYYTDSEKDGTIYKCLDDEDIGDKVGIFDKNGVAIFD